MPKKTPKIDVISGTLKFHIPFDRKDRNCVIAAYAIADGILAAVQKSRDETGIFQVTLESHLNRVSAPEPTPEASGPVPEAPDADPPDNLDIPETLRRGRTEPAAAE